MSHERKRVVDAEPLYRQFQDMDLQIRNGDGREGRTVFGVVAPYETRSGLINDRDGIYHEVFQRGAFAKSLRQRWEKVFLYQVHQRDGVPPLGRPTLLEDRTDHVWGEFFVPNTTEGNDALERIREGIYNDFSVGMVPVNTRWAVDGAERLAVRTEAALIEVSLVPIPAYDAPVAGLRSSSPVADTAPVETPDAAPAIARVSHPQHMRRKALYREGILR